MMWSDLKNNLKLQNWFRLGSSCVCCSLICAVISPFLYMSLIMYRDNVKMMMHAMHMPVFTCKTKCM